MMGVIALIFGLGLGIFTGIESGSFLVGLIATIVSLAVFGNIAADFQIDINQATQHQRDKAILNELRKMNDKE